MAVIRSRLTGDRSEVKRSPFASITPSDIPKEIVRLHFLSIYRRGCG